MAPHFIRKFFKYNYISNYSASRRLQNKKAGVLAAHMWACFGMAFRENQYYLENEHSFRVHLAFDHWQYRTIWVPFIISLYVSRLLAAKIALCTIKKLPNTIVVRLAFIVSMLGLSSFRGKEQWRATQSYWRIFCDSRNSIGVRIRKVLVPSVTWKDCST